MYKINLILLCFVPLCALVSSRVISPHKRPSALKEFLSNRLLSNQVENNGQIHIETVLKNNSYLHSHDQMSNRKVISQPNGQERTDQNNFIPIRKSIQKFRSNSQANRRSKYIETKKNPRRLSVTNFGSKRSSVRDRKKFKRQIDESEISTSGQMNESNLSQKGRKTYAKKSGWNLKTFELNSTKPEIKSTAFESNSTKSEIIWTIPELNSTEFESDSTKPEIILTIPELNSTEFEFNSTEFESDSTTSEIDFETSILDPKATKSTDITDIGNAYTKFDNPSMTEATIKPETEYHASTSESISIENSFQPTLLSQYKTTDLDDRLQLVDNRSPNPNSESALAFEISVRDTIEETTSLLMNKPVDKITEKEIVLNDTDMHSTVFIVNSTSEIGSRTISSETFAKFSIPSSTENLFQISNDFNWSESTLFSDALRTSGEEDRSANNQERQTVLNIFKTDGLSSDSTDNPSTISTSSNSNSSLASSTDVQESSENGTSSFDFKIDTQLSTNSQIFQSTSHSNNSDREDDKISSAVTLVVSPEISDVTSVPRDEISYVPPVSKSAEILGTSTNAGNYLSKISTSVVPPWIVRKSTIIATSTARKQVTLENDKSSTSQSSTLEASTKTDENFTTPLMSAENNAASKGETIGMVQSVHFLEQETTDSIAFESTENQLNEMSTKSESSTYFNSETNQFSSDLPENSVSQSTGGFSYIQASISEPSTTQLTGQGTNSDIRPTIHKSVTSDKSFEIPTESNASQSPFIDMLTTESQQYLPSNSPEFNSQTEILASELSSSDVSVSETLSTDPSTPSISVSETLLSNVSTTSISIESKLYTSDISLSSESPLLNGSTSSESTASELYTFDIIASESPLPELPISESNSHKPEKLISETSELASSELYTFNISASSKSLASELITSKAATVYSPYTRIEKLKSTTHFANSTLKFTFPVSSSDRSNATTCKTDDSSFKNKRTTSKSGTTPLISDLPESTYTVENSYCSQFKSCSECLRNGKCLFYWVDEECLAVPKLKNDCKTSFAFLGIGSLFQFFCGLKLPAENKTPEYDLSEISTQNCLINNSWTFEFFIFFIFMLFVFTGILAIELLSFFAKPKSNSDEFRPKRPFGRESQKGFVYEMKDSSIESARSKHIKRKHGVNIVGANASDKSVDREGSQSFGAQTDSSAPRKRSGENVRFIVYELDAESRDARRAKRRRKRKGRRRRRRRSIGVEDADEEGKDVVASRQRKSKKKKRSGGSACGGSSMAKELEPNEFDIKQRIAQISDLNTKLDSDNHFTESKERELLNQMKLKDARIRGEKIFAIEEQFPLQKGDSFLKSVFENRTTPETNLDIDEASYESWTSNLPSRKSESAVSESPPNDKIDLKNENKDFVIFSVNNLRPNTKTARNIAGTDLKVDLKQDSDLGSKGSSIVELKFDSKLNPPISSKLDPIIESKSDLVSSKILYKINSKDNLSK